MYKKYKTKKKLNAMRTKDMFLKGFLKTVGEAASLVIIRSIFMKRLYRLWNGEFWECGA